jgi:hypothetical protein
MWEKDYEIFLCDIGVVSMQSDVKYEQSKIEDHCYNYMQEELEKINYYCVV